MTNMRKERSPSYLKTWMINATAQEIRALAKASGTTVNYLHQISGGFRNPSLELSTAIVNAASELRKLRPALPEISIEYLSPPCHSCVYFKRCKGDDGRAAAFVDGR